LTPERSARTLPGLLVLAVLRVQGRSNLPPWGLLGLAQWRRGQLGLPVQLGLARLKLAQWVQLVLLVLADQAPWKQVQEGLPVQ
jgi:hypothetical protein